MAIYTQHGEPVRITGILPIAAGLPGWVYVEFQSNKDIGRRHPSTLKADGGVAEIDGAIAAVEQWEAKEVAKLHRGETP